METLTLSTAALEELGRMLRTAPIAKLPTLFLEVLNQKPTIVLVDDKSDNKQE